MVERLPTNNCRGAMAGLISVSLPALLFRSILCELCGSARGTFPVHLLFERLLCVMTHSGESVSLPAWAHNGSALWPGRQASVSVTRSGVGYTVMYQPHCRACAAGADRGDARAARGGRLGRARRGVAAAYPRTGVPFRREGVRLSFTATVRPLLRPCTAVPNRYLLRRSGQATRPLLAVPHKTGRSPRTSSGVERQATAGWPKRSAEERSRIRGRRRSSR